MIRELIFFAGRAWRWWLSEFLALLPRAYLNRLVPSRPMLHIRADDAITKIAVMASDRRLLEKAIAYPEASEESLSVVKGVIDVETKGKRVDVIGVIPEGEILARPLT